MRKLLSVIVSLMTAMAFAQQPVELPLWPDGAPNSNGLTGGEKEVSPHRLSNVTAPTITVYRAPQPNGMAVIMCPGGGYSRLAMDHEGHDMACLLYTSNTDVKKCPTGVFPEYAFIGRSNVGKSSLINMLTARKGLAMTSATPGKTMLINHFLINQSWYLVDLPGYGYARRGQKGKDQIRTIIEDYILEREQMTNLFVLIDSRLEPQKIDLEFMEWLGENGIPFSIIFTKADKLKGGRLKMNINNYLRELSKEWEELPPYFISSSENRTGRTEILDYIENISKEVYKNK